MSDNKDKKNAPDFTSLSLLMHTGRMPKSAQSAPPAADTTESPAAPLIRRQSSLVSPGDPKDVFANLCHRIYGAKLRDVSQDERREDATMRATRVAGLFTEIYRVAYPYMSEESRLKMIDFITTPQSEWLRRWRGREARALAEKIVTEHKAAIETQEATPLDRFPYSRVTDVAMLTETGQMISKALLAGRYVTTEQEITRLTSQLSNIPLIPTLTKNPESLTSAVKAWVSRVSQVDRGR